MEKEIKKIVHGRSDGVRYPGQKFTSPDIIEWKEVSEVIKTGEGKHDFYIKKSIVACSRTKRKDYINSFRNDVGVLNMLKKVAISGKNVADVIEGGRFASAQKDLVDLSNLPDNMVDAFKAVEKGVAAFDKLPDDIRKKASFAQFASMTDEEINKLVQEKVDRILANRVKDNDQKKEEVK